MSFLQAVPARARLGLAVCLASALAASAAAQQAAELGFDIMEFEISGNTALPTAAVEQAVTPFLGPQRSMAQVEAARAALERAYQQAGFLTVLVDVPEQRVDDGLIRLQVLEGRVRSLRVTGSRYFSQGYIRNTVAELAPGSVPNFNVVQEQLATLNRTEDRRVQPVLKPGPLPSTVDVELQVKDQLPATASLEVNNRYAPATTPWRLQLALAYNNLWQRSHSFSLTAITAPSNTDQSSLLITSYGMPWANGGSFTGYLVASDSLVQPLNAVTVAGKGLNLGLRWQLPLPPLPNIGHSLQWGLDYKDYETSTVTGELGVFTPLRYLPFTLGYSGGYFEGNRSTTLNTQLVAAQRNILRRSVDCADAGPADQFACSARNAQGTFSYWRGEVRHSHPVWGASRLGLRLGWQLTSDPLVGNERYAIGGAESVRGYAEAAASGDRAVLLGMQWDSPNLGGKEGWDLLNWFEEARAYAFFEAAEVRILNALPEQPVGTRLRGTGLGLQWRTGKHSNGQLDLAVPLVTQGEDRSGKARLHVRVQVAL